MNVNVNAAKGTTKATAAPKTEAPPPTPQPSRVDPQTQPRAASTVTAPEVPEKRAATKQKAAPKAAVKDAPLVRDAQLEAVYPKVLSLHAREAKWARRGRNLLLITAIGEGLVIGGLAFALAAITPTVRAVPFFIWARPDGVVETQAAMSMLPPTAQNAVLRASLWQYVLWREGYSYDTAKFRHDFVVAYSSGEVGKQYTDWFNYPNPGSPQVWLGKNGTVTVEPVSADFREDDPHVYEVTYTRILKQDGRPEQRATFKAHIHFRQRDTILAKDRTTINPTGIEVISYPDPDQISPPSATPQTQEKRQ
jgi:type IV secretion system protein VirB8